MNDIEKIPVQFTKESINTIKRYGTFAQVLNSLVTILREDDEIKEFLLNKLCELNTNKYHYPSFL